MQLQSPADIHRPGAQPFPKMSHKEPNSVLPVPPVYTACPECSGEGSEANVPAGAWSLRLPAAGGSASPMEDFSEGAFSVSRMVPRDAPAPRSLSEGGPASP